MIYQQDKMMKTMMEESNKTPKVNNSNLIILIILRAFAFYKISFFSCLKQRS